MSKTTRGLYLKFKMRAVLKLLRAEKTSASSESLDLAAMIFDGDNVYLTLRRRKGTTPQM
jgi:hypothetical protein